MSDQPSTPKPSKGAAAPAAAPAPATKAPATRKPGVPRGLGRAVRDLGPYALAMGVFAISAHWTLNSTAARYADELFAIALVLIRTRDHLPPPSKP